MPDKAKGYTVSTACPVAKYRPFCKESKKPLVMIMLSNLG